MLTLYKVTLAYYTNKANTDAEQDFRGILSCPDVECLELFVVTYVCRILSLGTTDQILFIKPSLHKSWESRSWCNISV